MTALAAVIALSSTPLLAQAADPAAVTAPMISAPAPTVAAATPAPAEVAPTISAPAPVATQSKPVYHTADSQAESSGEDDGAAVATPKRAAPSHATVATASRVTASKASNAAPVVERSAPQPAAPIPAAAVSPPQPTPAPVRAAPIQTSVATPSNTTATIDDAEIAGGAAFLFILAGGAFALSRRKRRSDQLQSVGYDEDEAIVAAPIESNQVPIAEPQPALVEPRLVREQPVFVAEASTAAALANGFDISRFGPHVQAAYQGPTADNPSLSLKKRLHRAAALDQRERMAEEQGREPAPATAGLPEQVVARAESDEQVVYRPAAGRARRGFRPVWQK